VPREPRLDLKRAPDGWVTWVVTWVPFLRSLALRGVSPYTSICGVYLLVARTGLLDAAADLSTGPVLTVKIGRATNLYTRVRPQGQQQAADLMLYRHIPCSWADAPPFEYKLQRELKHMGAVRKRPPRGEWFLLPAEAGLTFGETWRRAARDETWRRAARDETWRRAARKEWRRGRAP
jgi:hypothetical protein